MHDELMEAWNAGQASVLEQKARFRLQTHPDDTLAMTFLGLSLQMQGRPLDAAEVYRLASELEPDQGGHWTNRGTALREAGEMVKATEAYQQALSLDPDNAMHHHNLGLLKMAEADYGMAREHLLDAFERAPHAAPVRVHAAMACHECGDAQRVEWLIEPWQDWIIDNEDMALDLAWLLSATGQSQAAQALLEACIGQTPHPARAQTRLITLFERINRLDEAHALARQLPSLERVGDLELRQDILNVQAQLALRAGEMEAAYQHFQNLLASSPDPRKCANLYFALARVCDRMGRHDEAMQACAEAHRHQLQGVASLVPEMLPEGVEPLKSSLSRWTPEQRAAALPVHVPEESESPIFIIGFPRSGTTLLEQMLDTDPTLRSMDERPFLQNLADRMEAQGLRYPEDLGLLDDATCQAMRETYWQAVSSVVTLAPGQRLVDKNPLNMLRIPLIHRLFPRAKIILALRHPCDVLLSCYMQSFRSPAFAVLCSSLARLAGSYAHTMALWPYYATMLGPQGMELRYEDLVEDPRAQAQRLAGFLDLNNAETLLGFQQHAKAKGYISTPSYAQVVEGINRKGLNRWHAYRSYFEPVLAPLQPFLDRWGYSR